MGYSFIIFHLNLAFSSVEEHKREEIIKKCYWPILDIAENQNICVGIELTGWTLTQISILDPNWINKFKKLLSEKKCELIGSGWTQLIGPLVPYYVNIWNQKIGLTCYEKILTTKPKVALVNEMAYSRSLINIYTEVGYEAIIMDRDNIKLSLGIDNDNNESVPTHGLGTNNNSLPIIWSDSNLFQKFQRIIHSDISEDEYFEYLNSYLSNNNIIPIYTNDAEVFNFRPGRFTTENNLNSDDEWEKIKNLLNKISKKFNVKWISPTEVMFKIKD